MIPFWLGIAVAPFVLAFAFLHTISWLFRIPPRTKQFLMRVKDIRYWSPDISQSNILTGNFLRRPIFTPHECTLSIIVPCMNEELRLPAMLRKCIEYCERRALESKGKWTYEIIIADDGSSDRTCEVAMEIAKEMSGNVAVLRLGQNFGKGGAVRNGVMCARGSLILFADADGATEFSDYDKLEAELIRMCSGDVDPTFPGLVVGSRSHLEDESIARRSTFRTFLMLVFHLIVYVFAVRKVKDTQCGFKLFTRASAAELFSILHIERWAFDVELLFLAELKHFAIGEVAVRWEEIEGSKVTPVWSWIQMGRDVGMIWYRYFVGIWKDTFPNDL